VVEVLLSSVPPDGDLSGALKVQKTPVRVQAVADIFQTSAGPGVAEEEKIPVRVVVEAANNGGSSGEANAAVVAEPLAHNRPTTRTISQLPRPSIDRADVRLMLRRLVMNDFYTIVSLTPTTDTTRAII
jgi:hypothetical protein